MSATSTTSGQCCSGNQFRPAIRSMPKILNKEVGFMKLKVVILSKMKKKSSDQEFTPQLTTAEF